MNAGKKKILYCGAHFDDEVFILSKLIKHRNDGDLVRWLWASEPELKSDKKRRRLEHRRAMEYLNVEVRDMYILNFEDRKLYIYIQFLFLEILKILKSFCPDVVYLPAYEGGNVDHDILHFVLATAIVRLKLKVELREYTLYNSWGTRWIFVPYLFGKFLPRKDSRVIHRILESSEQVFIREYFSFYKSQCWKTILFMKFFGRESVFREEQYRLLPIYDYSERPTLKISYEIYQNVSFDDFVKSCRFLLNSDNGKKSFEPALLPGYISQLQDKRNWIRVMISNVLKG